MSSISTWVYGDGGVLTALAQAWPCPALVGYSVWTGHRSRLEALLDLHFRRYVPWGLHELRLDVLIPAVHELSQRHLAQETEDASYAEVSATTVRIESGRVHVEQLGRGFAVYSSLGLIADRFSNGLPARAQRGQPPSSGTRRATTVDLGSASAVLLASELIANMMTPQEVVSSMVPAELPALGATAVRRHRALVPIQKRALTPFTGCAAQLTNLPR